MGDGGIVLVQSKCVAARWIWGSEVVIATQRAQSRDGVPYRRVSEAELRDLSEPEVGVKGAGYGGCGDVDEILVDFELLRISSQDREGDWTR